MNGPDPELPRPRGWVVPAVGAVASFATGLLVLWVDWLYTSVNRIPGPLTWLAVVLLTARTVPWIAGAIYQARRDRLTVIHVPGERILQHVQQLRDRVGDTGVLEAIDAAVDRKALMPAREDTRGHR